MNSRNKHLLDKNSQVEIERSYDISNHDDSMTIFESSQPMPKHITHYIDKLFPSVDEKIDSKEGN